MSKPPRLVKDNWKYYTLSAAAYSALEDIQEDESQFSRFLHFAMEGYRDFNIDQSHQLECVELEMKSWKQIDMPIDLVDWVKVGFWDGNLIRVLTREHQNNVPKLFKSVGGVPQANLPPADNETLPITQDMLPFLGYSNFFGSPASERIYGFGSTYNYLGYFDVDMKNRVFNFKQTVDKFTKVYLEYVSDGINYSGKTLINPMAFKLIKNYIHWQRKEHDDRYGLGDKSRAQSLYNQERGKVAVRMLDLSIDTIREILRSGYTQVVHN